MSIKVRFEDGDVTEIKIKNGNNIIGYANLEGDGAYITTVYPPEGGDGVQPSLIGDIVDKLESLPFVDYAKFNYNP